jgi:hypothetical protein
VAAIAIGLSYVAILASPDNPPAGAPDGTLTPVPFDPLLEGPGILRPGNQILPVVALGAAMVVLVLGMSWALRWRWHNLVLRAAPVLLFAGALAGLATHPGFVEGNSHGPAMGYDVRVPPPPGSNGLSTWYTTAEPGGTTVLFMTVRNPGPLSIRLEGLVEEAADDTPLIPRWVALWLAVDPNAFGFLTNVRPFEPTVVDPEEQLQLYLVGRAGACAYGPGYEIDTPVEAWTTRRPDVTLVYSVLGLANESSVDLPVTLVEPYRLGCS